MTSRTTTTNLPGITASVRAQAKVRIMVGLPVLLLGLVAIWYWGTPYAANGVLAVTTVATLHALYMVAAFFLSSGIRQDAAVRYLVIGTAILDPLVLSGWLMLMSEFGALFVCFYLFTILGFGFRVDRQAMWICQVTSLIGFAIVLAIVPSWHENLIFGFSLFAVLAVVPMYATNLIKTVRDAQSRAEFESQAKSQLLAKVSHELRTPLSGIVASAQLISVEALDVGVGKRAEIILRLSNDLLLEINDLLDSAKFEAKALRLEPALVDLASVMEQVRLTFAATAAAKNIDYVVTVDPHIEYRVQCDAHQLSRALKNLVGNAVKFTDRGKVEVSLKLLRSNGDDYRIRFSVQDTGIGIPLELQQKIFDPFFQVSAGADRQYGGTGLGMGLAKEVVTMMGGEIIVHSEPGRGSLFYFDINLPIVRKSLLEPPTSARIRPIFGKRILVADDNQTNLILTQELLEVDRHTVSIAKDGEAALQLLNSERFDVVFLDYNMRGMDGGEVLQIYRFGKVDTAPVFFLTADTTTDTTAKLLEAGAAGVLYKPITNEGLRRAIVQACHDNGASGWMRSAPVAPKPRPVPLRFIPPKYLNLSVIENLQALSQRPEFFSEVLSSATSDIEHNSNSLLESIAAQNIQQIHDIAHALSGVSESVGAVRLALLARKLMRADHRALKTENERWKYELAEATQQSLNCLRDVLLHQKTIH